MLRINQCFDNQLLQLCQQAVQVEQLNNKIKGFLAKPLANYCQVGAFNRGCLVITVQNAAWATELRYKLPELRDQLRKAGLFQLTSIKIAIAEATENNSKPLPKRLLTPVARKSLLTASELCSYPPLKNALWQAASK